MDPTTLSTIVPSHTALPGLDVRVVTDLPDDIEAVAVPVTSDGDVPDSLGLDRDALRRAGFTGAIGSALALPVPSGPVLVATGIGEVDALTSALVRDAAAVFARAVPRDAALAVAVPSDAAVGVGEVTSAAIEGILLARHRWSLRTTDPAEVPVSRVVIVVAEESREAADEGVRRGLIGTRVSLLARDLATSPAYLLTAERMAEVATTIGVPAGLEVEVHDRASLETLGCGGLLGVNRGSAREPRMVVLHYRPEGEPSGHLALVGKGIMFDSGGISIKPGDESHSQMKNDMTGAGDVLAAMTGLRDLGCTAEVTGYLMCTDNMPSGTAMLLGDILTIRGGKTVEVLNTDAEGRLVMADALVLAAEAGADAIIDIATLTGACLRALGTRLAGVMGSSPELVSQLEAAGATVDEPLWEFPVVDAYRKELDSDVADLRNIGGINAGQITAALFLREFVDGLPWAHVDIAGTAQAPAEDRWIRRGPTGFGARLLLATAVGFEVPSAE